MKALFIASHCDDELCFAGAMQKFESSYISFSNCNSTELHNECLKSLSILKPEQFEIFDYPVRKFRSHKQKIADDIRTWNTDFDFVFTHSVKDIHPDHRTIAEETIRVVKGNLLTYIGPWNGDEDCNYFIEISKEQLEMKIKAMKGYKSQAHRPYMDPEFIRAWARYNGIRCGKKYAEGFHTQRLIV